MMSYIKLFIERTDPALEPYTANGAVHRMIRPAGVSVLTCETLKTPPPPGPGRSDEGPPAGTAPGGSDPDGRSEKWTPGRLLSGSRAECRPLHYTLEYAGACAEMVEDKRVLLWDKMKNKT